MKTSIVRLDNIRPIQFRFDASYHLSEGEEVKRFIHASPFPLLKISDVSNDIFIGNRAKRVYVKKRSHGTPFLSSSDILQADLENVKIASNKYTPNIEQMKLQKGWTLISRSGTIGNCAFANAKHAQKLASEDVIRLVPNNILREGLIYAYLASKYGHSLLTQGTFGAVIQHIEPDFVGSLPIPDFPESFQKEVDDLIQESARLREEATEVLDKAKDILSKYINVSFNKEHFKTSVVSSKDIWNSLQHRLDPPAIMNDGVYSMQDITSKINYTTIANINGKVYRPGIFKRNYVSNGIPYIKGSEIFLTNPFRRCEQLSRMLTPFIDEMSMKEGQILITCAGSVGDIKLITKEYEDKKSIGSQDIIRLESNDVLYTKEYLFVYLQQPFVYDYIQSMKYGSVIERIEPFHVESIPVIEPTKELSEEITSIVRHYMDCTYRAFNCEENAISMVEQEIEKWNKQ